MSSDELISPEFRQEVIVQTIKDIATGRLIYDADPEVWEETVLQDFADYSKVLTEAIDLYTSRLKDAKSIEEKEESIFRAIYKLRGNGVLKPRDSSALYEGEISKLNDKLDSNNRFLKVVLDVLKEILKKLDK